MSRITPLSVILCLICFLIGCNDSPKHTLYDLRCENLQNPLSIGHTTPHLSWKLKAGQDGEKQIAFQVLVATNPALLEEGKTDLWDSGKNLSPASVMIKYAGKDLTGEPLAYWKVRVWDTADNATEWSETACFGTGLSENEIHTAQYIGYPKETGNPQSPLLRKKFEVSEKTGKILLYVNSLGYHEVYINGKKVGDHVLTPAVSQMNKRSLYNTYDITSYVNEGNNDLVVWLGQGWYRPGLLDAYDGPLAKVWLKAEQEDRWKTLIVSDQSWLATESGYASIGSWRPLQFGGEHIDASVLPEDMTISSLDKLSWHAVVEIDVPAHAISPQMTEENRITETIKAIKITQLSDSVWLADMGQALTGWAEIKFPALTPGQEIILTYADHLDEQGNPASQNQEDRYIASGKANETFCSKFNYHGFQYIQISNLATPPEINHIAAHLIQTDFRQTSSFECSDADMNAIHDMFQYTLRNLSLGGYLVDCTQLERLGYGGDGNASTETAQTMFDLSPLYSNWMQAWADCIREDGGMPHTAPNPYPAGGGPYWCGFIITASWRTYVNYGDSRLIEKYYPVMQHWLSYVDKYTVDGLLEPWPDTPYRGWYLGDWACPRGIDQTNPASIGVVNNSFISVCYETMEKIATFLGKPEDAKLYTDKRSSLQKRIQEAFYSEEKGIYSTGSQIDLVYPMLSGVTPQPLLEKVTQHLFEETEQNRQGHLACGLVGIPVITEWAVKNNQPDFIYSMLKKRDYPGYLYMIDNGATATWEHWDGARSRLHNCYNGIGSWFYQAIGGIRPDEHQPGYKLIWINPQIPAGITWAKTSKETPYGLLSVNWEIKENKMNMEITIPPGSTANVVLPVTITEYTLNEKQSEKTKSNILVLESGKYRLSY
ncbi:MAG: glycoside hydrolase family 78 protein [Tannerella sp.]|jgi:alpha-L-rhamnosidase|nr:glycoside hydrolase family 78 protein [Tannerella sp.]